MYSRYSDDSSEHSHRASFQRIENEQEQHLNRNLFTERIRREVTQLEIPFTVVVIRPSLSLSLSLDRDLILLFYRFVPMQLCYSASVVAHVTLQFAKDVEALYFFYNSFH